MAAKGGTIFLDEIGNLSYEVQVQLLRALQERTIKPIGSNQEISIDVRLITATNENLRMAIDRGEFREDLYHRINEFTIRIPDLKDRKEDLMIFANGFLEQANKELQKNVIGFDNETVNIFESYSWMYKDENFDEKVGGLVCEVSGRYRIEELESRLIRVINDLHQKTYSQYYLGELNFITEGITIEKRYGTALAALCFVDFIVPELGEE